MISVTMYIERVVKLKQVEIERALGGFDNFIGEK